MGKKQQGKEGRKYTRDKVKNNRNLHYVALIVLSCLIILLLSLHFCFFYLSVCEPLVSLFIHLLSL
jgi:hypothetical protein